MVREGQRAKQRFERRTSLWRPPVALVAGTMTGAALTGLAWGVTALIGGSPVAATLAVIIILIAFWVWAIGLIVLGAPGLAIYHAIGARRPVETMLLGGGLAYGAMTLFLLSIGQNNGGNLMMAAIVGGIGAIVGWVINRVTYSRMPVEPLLD